MAKQYTKCIIYDYIFSLTLAPSTLQKVIMPETGLYWIHVCQQRKSRSAAHRAVWSAYLQDIYSSGGVLELRSNYVISDRWCELVRTFIKLCFHATPIIRVAYYHQDHWPQVPRAWVKRTKDQNPLPEQLDINGQWNFHKTTRRQRLILLF